MPAQLFARRPAQFVVKFVFAIVLVSIGFVLIIEAIHPTLTLVAVVLVGTMYAHLVELQHECLHGHAFNSRRLNGLFGFVCGMAMLSSYSHYRYDHMRHHANLGSPKNREFFNYRFRNLDSWPGFVLASLHPGALVDFATNALRSLSGRMILEDASPRDERRVKAEYRLLFVTLIAAMTLTGYAGQWRLVLLAWVVPLVLVAIPAHFLFEMPEHFGLDTQYNPNVLENTRTIHASRFAQWITNKNNFHTAHHLHPGVPMASVGKWHRLATADCATLEPSYWIFYLKVVRGDVRYDDYTRTCMTR